MAYYRYSINYYSKRDYPWLLTWECPGTVNGQYAMSLFYTSMSNFEQVKSFIATLKQSRGQLKRVQKL